MNGGKERDRLGETSFNDVLLFHIMDGIGLSSNTKKANFKVQFLVILDPEEMARDSSTGQQNCNSLETSRTCTGRGLYWDERLDLNAPLGRLNLDHCPYASLTVNLLMVDNSLSNLGDNVDRSIDCKINGSFRRIHASGTFPLDKFLKVVAGSRPNDLRLQRVEHVLPLVFSQSDTSLDGRVGISNAAAGDDSFIGSASPGDPEAEHIFQLCIAPQNDATHSFWSYDSSSNESLII
jgi:hypothetical protein